MGRLLDYVPILHILLVVVVEGTSFVHERFHYTSMYA